MPNLTGTDTPIDAELGGILAVVNLAEASIEATLYLPRPSGMLERGGHLYVTSMANHSVFEIDSNTLAITREIKHRLLSYPHSVASGSLAGADALLVSSTGVDALVELSGAGELKWLWSARDNGFDLDPLAILMWSGELRSSWEMRGFLTPVAAPLN